jgi:EAL domain-containing protein (putative c-di-GMP-specific phosphodiesterase class I)
MPSLISERSFVYQPIVTPEKTVVGYEVLTRHPKMTPQHTIHKIEKEHLVPHHIISMLAHIQSRIPKTIPAFINITPKVLLSECTRALLKNFSETHPIILELTEDVSFIPYKGILSDLNVPYIFDDFLSRHTLDEVAELEPVGIKISNVHTLKYLESHKDLFRAVVRFANELELLVVIEGIETRETFDFCLEEGVFVQGFYVSRPVQMPLLAG